MARACTVCTSPSRSEIDAAIVEGRVPKSGLARKHGLSVDALERHAKSHLPIALLKAADAEEATSAGNLLERVRAAEVHARSLARQAQEEGDLRAAVAGLKVVLDALALLDRVAERLAEKRETEPRTLAEFFARIADGGNLDVS